MKTLICLMLMCSSVSFAQTAERFKLIQLGTMRADQYLLDTQTGKLWQNRCLKGSSSDCDLAAFTVYDVEGITVTLDGLRKKLEKGESN